jgi:hypothetical protein
MRKILISAALATFSLSIAGAAVAAPACTTQPKSKWMTEAQMRAKVDKLGYTKIKVLQVSGSCYEIYAQNKAGKKAEVYFNPVTGAIVQNNVD